MNPSWDGPLPEPPATPFTVMAFDIGVGMLERTSRAAAGSVGTGGA